MKLWISDAWEYEDELVNQLLLSGKLKLLQGEFDYLLTLDKYKLFAESYGLVLYPGVQMLFYIVTRDYEEEELYMFLDDMNMIEDFYSELFVSDFDRWLDKVRGLIEENKKWLH
jgi:lipopolysaccharide assembly outer membrane protein LptD (OstA)